MRPATARLAKVAGGYVSGAVLALEAGTTLAQPLGTGGVAYWLFLLALLTGLPLAILTTVVLVRRSPQIETEGWLGWASPAMVSVAVVTVLAIAGSGLYWIAFADDGIRARAAAAAGPSVMVMPFRNLSAETENSYFAAGLSEELTRVFGELAGVRVASGFAAAGGVDRPAVEVARELGLRTILEGTVARSSERIRVTARLVKSEDGVALWSGKYDREFQDVFALQDELSADIVSQLSPTVSRSKSALAFDWGTRDPAAWDLYLQARHELAREDAADTARALTLLASALEADPDFLAARGLMQDLTRRD